MRVLKWIVDRVHGRAHALQSPLGYVPAYEDIDWTGSDFSKAEFNKLMTIRKSAWKAELLSHEELLVKMSERLPEEIRLQRQLLLCAFNRAPEVWTPEG